MSASAEHLQRGLGERHIRLMALGSAIGVGLFLGAGNAIKMAGPAIMLAYLIGGAMIFLIMRALGEMAVHNPVAGSFCRYAQDHMGPLAGYLTGWNYWFLWLVTCVAEITAVAIYMGMWFPDVPRWIWALAALAAMGSVNLMAVKAYGEFEFWFAMIKIVTIVLMLIGGGAMIVFGFGNGGVATGISNLWAHGGFMPNGASGVLMSLQMVMFAYLGVEMIGLTAGEARNPKKSIPDAINSVFWRILIFYVGALFVILALYPWNEIGAQGSPFVLTFERLGIKTAAGIINFVVLTAALSSCNGGIFSTGRMLYNLSLQGQAPAAFATVDRNGVPRRALLVSIAALLAGVLLNYLVPEKVFVWVTAISTFGAVWTWAIILVTQIQFRRGLSAAERKALAFRMPFWPYGSYIALAFLALVVALMAYFPDTRVALYVGPGWLVLLTICYFALDMRSRGPVSYRA
ncbi:amino acid permease [Cupriavidus taiwanensis]|uniref:Proline transport protein, APC family n=1 Tax=Cupriavidus taiwanensis TaxID=164546 RepID=A0A375DLK0_9BURK|nr:amino acid permease [Cupriavidus taiwanensis]SOY64629.1 proline transport protein, APC family [Cupriavidus taiwanensis]SOZ08686.1 proline transport protein, APC family [Cupriavidus taiwanensis]SOZ11023.1 proline transport protein, APC family [Cupriavidus taiwanensis]SOZ42348.1 proline transport protein, APC family [Cupriavidus taiwanensis]SPC20415.1 proline transporter [Cupriavidus taiwanensis]